MDLAKRILNLSPAQRKLLELKLKSKNVRLPVNSSGKKKKISANKNITPAEEKEYYPLSSSQQRFYILNQFVEYTLPLAFQVEGEMNRKQFEEACQALLKRHGGLRTAFVLIGEETFQKIYQYKEVEFNIEYYDCSEKTGDSSDGVDTALKQVLRPFAISVPPLLRVGLIQLPEQGHLFVINMHHLVSDGVSQGILIKEFLRLYNGEELPPLRIRYQDYSEWQNRVFKPGEYKKQEKYWCDSFSGDIPLLNLPTDYPRPEMQDYDGIRLHFEIKGEILQNLKTLALKQGASPYMVLMAVTYILLFRYSGQEDIVLGTISAGREQLELQGLIGVFVNPLAARNYPAPHKTFTGFLKELKYNTFKAFENQSYPFGDLVEKVVQKKDLSRSPLFDVMFIFLNRRIEREEAAGLQFTRCQLGQQYIAHAQQDITFYAIEEDQRIRLDLEYSTALFKQETIERLFRHFINLLQGASANPALKLPEIEMISPEEKHQLLEEFNDTHTDYPHEKTIQQLFSEQATRTPHHVALVGIHETHEKHEKNYNMSQMSYMSHLSYKKLNEKSHQLAHLLIEKGVRPDTIVGIMLERSIEMIIGILGILKAGGAYLPIDPQYPEERIKYMLEDSGVKILLTREEIAEFSSPETFNIGPKGTSFHLHLSPAPVTSLAYLIYTSGTTGRPKGVLVDQRSLVNAAFAWREEYRLQDFQVNLLQMASFSFDVFSGDIARAFISGGKLVICPEEVRLDFPALYHLIRSQWITLLESTPSLLIPFMEYIYDNHLKIDNLQLLIVGAESFRVREFKKLVSRFGDYIRIINSYGVTEATIDSSYFEQLPEHMLLSGSVPIGSPMSNMKFYILDSRGNLQPVGVPGELCIGGEGVTRGYLNNPELTREKFDHDLWDLHDYHDEINKSFCRGPGGSFFKKRPLAVGDKIYKTGDLARWLVDGNVECLGRMDSQVKIRGFRIELKEIETRLMAHHHIKETVLLTHEGNLLAYIVPVNPEKELNVSELKMHLSAQLPAYMIPARFIEINEIPLTINGKINKRVLLQLGEDIEPGAGYVAPENEAQQKLADIWTDILGRDRIGIDDNFFDQGGQSILAIKLVARIKETFHLRVPLITIFQEGTIRCLSRVLSGMQPDAPGLADISGKKGLVQPFDLDQAPLLRTSVVKLGDQGHFFFIDMHHIITDGISMDIITEEFTRLYQGDELKELPIQYKDFSRWQESFFESETFRKQEAYWLDIFSGEIPRLNLPLDFPRPEKRRGQGRKIKIKVEPALAQQLREFASRQQVTLFMLFLAAYTILLAKSSDQEDIIVGTPVSGRTHANVAQLVGMFVNTLALRNQPRNHLTFYEFLQNVKEQILSALENQDYPFDMLVEKLKLSGSANRNPLFDTMFALEQYYERFTPYTNKDTYTADTGTGTGISIGAGDNELRLIPYEMDQAGAMFDLSLGVIVTPGDIWLTFRYDLHLFEDHRVKGLARQFMNILSWITVVPERRLDEVHMEILPEKPASHMDIQAAELLEELPGQESLQLTPQQRERILQELNNTPREYPVSLTLPQLFEKQVAAKPSGIALIYGRQHLTYEELNRQSNRLAYFLMEKGVKTDAIVGLLLEPSVEMIIAILGILKAGGAYLPIDPESPPERIDYMLKDSRTKILLTREEIAGLFSPEAFNIGPKGTSFHLHLSLAPVTSLAYTIYTSGSTGKPKGVLISHANVCPLLHYGFKHLGIGPGEHTMQNLSYHFDWSVWEIFITLTTGAVLHVIPGEQRVNPTDSIAYIHKYAVTVLHITPTQWQYFLDTNQKIKPLKYLFIGAEKLSFNMVKRTIACVNDHCRIFNMYGPTEATIISSVLEIDRTRVDGFSELSGIPIGKTVGNTALLVLDKDLELCPQKEPGELYIGGHGVARGYLNNPELTAEKFIGFEVKVKAEVEEEEAPFGRILNAFGERKISRKKTQKNTKKFFPYSPTHPLTHSPIYRTGDLVRRLGDGNIEFLGRKDNQVKVRGFRLELGEIEAVLLKHIDVREAAVILREDPNGAKSLAAYIVSPGDLTQAELRDYLLQKLPDYMVPAFFFKVEQMPLTPTGKLDRKSLPQLGTAVKQGFPYTAPRNELEQQLAQAWAKILKLSKDKIGIDHNFFASGGDSLRGNLLLAEINHVFGTKIVMKDLFQAATIRELAGIFSLAQAKVETPMAPVEKKEYYPVSSAQKRLYVIRDLSSEDTSYNVPMGMTIEGRLDRNRLENAIKQLMRRHESLRTCFRVIDGEIVQKIEENTGFKVDLFEIKEKFPGMTNTEKEKWAKNTIEKIIKGDMPLDKILPYRENQDNLLATIELPRLELREKARKDSNRDYDTYEASSAQKRLYLVNRLLGDSTLYNMPFCWLVEGHIDPARLETAVKNIMQCHETLRTCFVAVEGEVLQKIYHQPGFPLQYREMGKDAIKNAGTVFNDFVRPFDLDQLPLWRMELVKMEKGKQLLLFDIHHNICDGISIDVMINDLMTFYNGEEPPELEYQYVDFTLWQNQQWNRERIKRQEQYWLKTFARELPVLDLPTDYPRSRESEITGTNIEFKVGHELTARLNQLATRNDTTLFVVLVAVYNVLLAKYTNQEDIIVGSAVSGRSHQEFNHIIGMFVNSLALRNYPGPGKTFKEFLHEVSQNTFSAFENQDYPFEILVEKVVPDRNLNRNPLFDTMLALQNYSRSIQVSDPHQKELALIPYSFKARVAKFDIALEMFERGGDITILLEYRTSLFHHETIRRFTRHFVNIITEVTNDCQLKIQVIQMMSEAEKDHLLYVLNDTAADYPGDKDKTIHELFEERVKQTPDHVALVGIHEIHEKHEKNNNMSHLSYMALNERANQLAHLLRKKGVKADTAVALMLDRSIEMIIGILGILKAGGAYLPIDSDYPEKRILSILEESGALYLLTAENISRSISFAALQSLNKKESGVKPVVTAAREFIKDFDGLPFPDRSLVNYEAYHQHIGIAMARHTVSLQATRGCPYKCAYCHKIWPKKHMARSAENLFAEMNQLYNAGMKRFVFVDDIFNLDKKNSGKLLEMLIKKMPGIQLFFSNGLRGDILTKEYIDLMVEAGTINMDLALESACPRIQKMIGKNLHLEKFAENVQYITQKYPQLLLEMELMIGFPTESEEEALMTLDFLKNFKWVHFPNINILKIYPNTDMCRLALSKGVSLEAIEASVNLAYHELPATLPFSAEFTRLYQARFVNEYMLSKERLLHVLRHQVKTLGKEELIEKYDSYFPQEIKDFAGILQLGGISQEEFGEVQWVKGDTMAAPRFGQEIKKYFPPQSLEQNHNPLRILLLDLSQFFTRDSQGTLYNVVEEPLGLMYLLSYLNRQFGNRIKGKIAKAQIDFNCFEELEQLILDFKPGLIGIRTLSYYSDFFHKTVAMIKSWGIEAPIIAGGPYATSDYRQLLQDHHINLVVLGEGEHTLTQLVEEFIANGNQMPHEDQLQNIPGIAFIKEKDKRILKQRKRNIIFMDQVGTSLEKQPKENPAKINNPGNLLYLVSTSGSTGKPKIVMLEHRNFHNLMEHQFSHLAIDFTRVLQFASIGFDVSSQEIFSALLSGGTLFLTSRETKYDISRLLDYIRQNVVADLFLPPAFLKYAFGDSEYAAAFPTGVKHIIAAGEQLVITNPFAKYLQANQVVLHNHYGPAETHVVTTLALDPHKEIPELPTIGKPIINTSIFILDRAGNLQPQGVVGELYIGGIPVGRGYLNKPELTAERFLATEDTEVTETDFNKKLYKTGDLARWRGDGNIEFLGRSDFQVKLRGFRIEPEEIQKQLCGHEDIKEAVVLTKENKNKDKYLCAYIVLQVPLVTAESADGITVNDLRTYLSKQLPDYMIPSYFIPVERIPLNSSGKVDKKALPEPEMEATKGYTPPRNEKEEKLVKIWSEVIGKNSAIGIEDNFFELGGHSLNAILMISKIHKEFNVKIPLETIFKHQTVKRLAAHLEPEEKNKYSPLQPTEKKEYYDLSSAQKRLYFIQQLDLNNTTYNLPLVFPLGKEVEKDKLAGALKKLLQRHESLRTSFIKVDNLPVQKIHDEVQFEIEFYNSGRQGDREVGNLLESSGREGGREAGDFLESSEGSESVPDKSSSLPISLFACLPEPSQKTPLSLSPSLPELTQDFIRPFDLTRAPLVRSGIIKLPGGSCIWMVDVHHIVSDGTSQTVLTGDFISLYNGEELEPLQFQYKDFAQWQNRLYESGDIKDQEDYWLNRCRDSEEIPRLDMFTDYKRPAVFTFAGDFYAFILEREEAAKFKELSLHSSGTLYMNFLAALNTLFYKYTGQTDMIMGSAIAGRTHFDLWQIVGMFVNTLVMRNYPAGEKTYQSFLQEVIDSSVQAFANQDLQFEELVDKLKVQRDPSRHPLFDIAVVNQNFKKPPLPLTTSEIFPAQDIEVEYRNPTARLDMNFYLQEEGEDVTIGIEYYTAIFKRDTILRLETHLKNIIKAVIKEPHIKLKDIEIITSAEKKQILHDFNDTRCDYPDMTIHQLFEEQANQTPDHVALVGVHETHEKHEKNYNMPPMSYKSHISYKELNEKSQRLAYMLQGEGVGPDTIVGIMLERSFEMIIGILGILKAGGAYLPIDPQYPEERIKYMLEDSGTKILLTREEIAGISSPEAFNIRPKGTSFHLHLSPAPVTSLAYILYTSGTTGKPRGVMIRHKSLVNYVLWGIRQYIANNEADNHYYFPFYTSISFDLTVTSIFLPLISGNTILVIVEDHTQPSLPILEVMTSGINVGIVKTTPSHLKLLRDGAMNQNLNPGIKKFIVGGEALETPLAADIYQDFPGEIEIYNEYGPTEATVGCMIYRYNHHHDQRDVVPIGKPSHNVNIFILDDNMKPVPCGAVGELYIGGDALARGYINQPELTAEQFLATDEHGRTRTNLNQNLLRGVQGGGFLEKNPPGRRRQKIYRTGDLGRMLPGGDIEFLGRKDQQVKIRGHRIEIQEIENHLWAHECIKDAVVLLRNRKTLSAHGQQGHEGYLCCYWTAVEEGISLESADLREYLSKRLPEYMIPAYFVPMESIPLTANGKVDLKALPEPVLTAGENHTPPGNEIEKKMVEIWQEILGLGGDAFPGIGINDNFFHLGGHSLKAALLATRLHNEFNLQVPLVEIFKTPTIKALAAYILDPAHVKAAPADNQAVLLKKGGPRAKNLFLLHDGTGEIDAYSEFALQLTDQFNCWGIPADRFDTLEPKNLKIETAAEKYINRIKTIQPHGPYYIAGWCVGGLIAYEIVKQLETGNEIISFLGIINSYVPRPEVPAKAKEFNIDTELAWVHGYLPGIEEQQLPTNGAGLKGLWSEIVKYLETRQYPVQKIKNFLPRQLDSVIPHYHQMGIRELIYHINVRRSFLKAQEFYLPHDKITAPVFFFAASDTEVSNKEKWNDYCSRPVKFYEISGDHYSIFREPQVKKFAETFGKVISQAL